MELLHYRIRLQDQAFLINRKQFVLLMEDLIYDSIDTEQIETYFSQLWMDTLHADIVFQMDLKKVENLQMSLAIS
jgi:hypothetical protein